MVYLKLMHNYPSFRSQRSVRSYRSRYKRYNQANMLRTQPRQNESGQSGDRGGKFSYRMVPVKYLKQIGFCWIRKSVRSRRPFYRR